MHDRIGSKYIRGPERGHLNDFDLLVPVLTAKFEPKNQREMYRAEVEARLRNLKEP